MGEGEGGEEVSFLHLSSFFASIFPLFPFSPETPDTQAIVLRTGFNDFRAINFSITVCFCFFSAG